MNKMDRIKRAAHYAGLLLACACCLALLAGCSERRSKQQSELGDTYLRLGNVQQAADAYDSALKLNPDNMAAKLGRSRCFAAQNNPDSALQGYKEVISSGQFVEAAHVDAIELLMKINRTDEAMALATEFAGKSAELGGLVLSRLETATGKNDAALERLEKLRTQFDKSVPVRVLLAKALLTAGRDQDAEKELKEVLDSVDSDSLPARMALVEVYRKQGRLDELLSQLEALAKENPNNPNMKLALARGYLAAGKMDDAEKIARTVLGESPESGWANFILGACLVEKKQYDEAAACLQAAAKALPDEPQAAELLAVAMNKGVAPTPQAAAAASSGGAGAADWQAMWISADLAALMNQRARLMQLPDENIKELLLCTALFLRQADIVDEITAQLPNDSPFRKFAELLKAGDLNAVIKFTDGWKEENGLRKELRDNCLGFALGSGGARAAAFQVLSECLLAWPDHGAALYNLSTIYGAAKMTELQAQCLKQLVRMHPGNVDAQLLLYSVLVASGRIDEARNQAQVTFTQYPSNARALSNLASIYRTTGDVKGARDVLARAIQSVPGDAGIRFQLAQLLLDSGESGQQVDEVLAGVDASSEMTKLRVDSIKAFASALSGAWGPAQELWTKAKEMSPPISVRLLCAASLLQAGQQADAAATLDGPDGKPIDTPASRVLLAAFGKATGEMSADENALAQKLAADPVSASDFALAQACLQSDMQTPALRILQSINVKLDGPSGLALPMLEAIARSQADGDKLAMAKAYVEQYANNATAWLALAAMSGVMQNTTAEGEAYEQAIKTAPDRYEAWLRYSLFLDKQKDFGNLINANRRMLELKPDDPVAENNLAYTLLRTNGSPQEAMDLAQKAIAKMGRQAHLLHTLGLAQLRLGMLEDAGKNLAEAVEVRPGDPTLLLDFGQALLAKGEKDKGKMRIQLALRYADQLGLDFPRRDEAVKALSE